MGQVCVEGATISRSHNMNFTRVMLQLQRDLPNSARRVGQPVQLRRNLFGPIDHQQNLKFVQDEMAKIVQADSRRWNFDFQAEKPLEGRYKWEPVDENVPQAYELPRLRTHRLEDNALSASSSSGNNSRSRPNIKKGVKRLHKKPSSPQLTQKLCTDYFKHVKVSKSSSADTEKQQKVNIEVVTNTTKPANITTNLSEVLKIRSLNVR